MEIHDLLAGIAVLVGLAGIVLVFLPGLALQVVAVLVWALEESSAAAWAFFGVTAAIAVTTSVLKYLYPGRQLKAAGVPSWLIGVALAAAVLGLFVIPIVGAPIGFVLTVYLFQRARLGRQEAWPATKAALRAVVTSTGIELTGGTLILVVFVAAAVVN